MADTDPSLYNLRYNLSTSNLEAFGGGSPQWTLITLNNVDPTQVPITRLLNTVAPLQGGGNLSADRTFSITQSSASFDGYLSSVDWITFNTKQPAGNYITALTGDGTAAGPGSVPLTLATVNGNVGTFAYASITVNAKGLITSASAGATGSLTDVGTDGIVITSGTGAVIGSGTSIAQHVADATHNGYLSSTDWNTFNNKESASLTNAHIFVGNASNVPADVALSGDATLANTGAMTLATVNSNVGSFTHSSITVNAKGLVTAAASATLTSAHIYVGNGSNVPTDVALSGDATLANTGALTLSTVNANVGSFTAANITVNAKGLITAASNGSAGVTSVSGTANQITSTGGSTPVLAIANPVTFPGAMTAGGALAMASNKITGLANGTASTDAAAFGQIKVLQTVFATSTSSFSTTSSTYQASNIAASITPTSSSNRILIIVSGNLRTSKINATTAQAAIFRSTTMLGTQAGAIVSSSIGSASSIDTPLCLIYVDSPATTSSTTYTAYLASSDNTTTCSIGDSTQQCIILMEVV